MAVQKDRFIIGITGLFGSGKTTAAKFFEKKGYFVVSLSSVLEKEAVKRNLKITRKVLQDLGNEMRNKKGAGVLMREVLENNNDKTKLVIDGIRNYQETVELKKNKKSVLLGIVANRNVRFERLKKLKRREKLTPKIFKTLDLRDLGVNEKITGLQTAICLAVSDYFIDSNKSINIFYKDLEDFLEKYEKTAANSN